MTTELRSNARVEGLATRESYWKILMKRHLTCWESSYPTSDPLYEKYYAANFSSLTFGNNQKYDKTCEKGANQFTDENSWLWIILFCFKHICCLSLLGGSDTNRDKLHIFFGYLGVVAFNIIIFLKSKEMKRNELYVLWGCWHKILSN